MSNRLSYSSVSRYLTCGESWKIHYHHRIRPKEISSALIFGSAIGRAFEYALNPSCSDLPNIANTYEFFDYHFRNAEVNGVLINVETSKDIVYSRYDHDADLGDTPFESLRAKGHLMIKSFEENFLPMVEKVYSTEEEVALANDQGDTTIGYADVIVKLKDIPNIVILDFKTASRRYEQDSVKSSVQLSQYMHSLSSKYHTRTAGYFVLLKNIVKNRQKICSKCKFDGSGARHKTCSNEIDGKRCNGDWTEKVFPVADYQLIIDEIPQRFEDLVIDNLEMVNTGIKAGVFTKNLAACSNIYGRPCEFFNRCHNDSMDGLVQLEAKKEEAK